MRICGALILAILFSALPTNSGAGTGLLQGTVRDATGAVLPGAVIFVQRWKLRNHSLDHPLAQIGPSVYADSQGRFSLRLPPDVYDVFVAYPTFAPYAKRVKIEAGKNTVLDCELPFDHLTRWVE
jgi:hypothetical protein